MKDPVQEEIIDEVSVFDEWLDKYDYLIGLSETLPPIAPEHRTEQYVIRGCQSRVWIDARLDEGRIRFTAVSAAGVPHTDLYFIDAIGLSANLSPTRANGLLAMIKQMRLYALAFASQAEPSEH